MRSVVTVIVVLLIIVVVLGVCTWMLGSDPQAPVWIDPSGSPS